MLWKKLSSTSFQIDPRKCELKPKQSQVRAMTKIDPNILRRSAIALTIGNTTINDIWIEHLEEIHFGHQALKDILVLIHTRAATNSPYTMKELKDYIMERYRREEGAVDNYIRILRKKGLIKSVQGVPSKPKKNDPNLSLDIRHEYIKPTQKTKEKLVEMGKAYADAISIALRDLVSKTELENDDIIIELKKILSSKIEDY